MKNILLALTVIAIISLEALAQKGGKVPYEFPEAMAAPIRAEFTKTCDKGQTLYDINCGKCHTTYVKRKKVVPDFSAEQMEAYQIRVLNPKHESELPETNVTAEELADILTFLTYKKKNK